MSQETTSKTPRDAFKQRMADAMSESGRPELAHQSVGREISAAEAALAAAMMDIYATGVSEPSAMAEALAERGIPAPSAGHSNWDVALLEAELHEANQRFDVAYLENGYGA